MSSSPPAATTSATSNSPRAPLSMASAGGLQSENSSSATTDLVHSSKMNGNHEEQRDNHNILSKQQLSTLTNATAEHSPQLIRLVSVGSLVLAWCLMFSLRTHIIIGCIAVGLGGLAYSTVLTIKFNGLLTYLPPHLQHQLLNESLIDIVQAPIINKLHTLNLMALFVTELSVDERQRCLSRLPPETARLFGTKGVVYGMSPHMQQLMLPPHMRNSPLQQQRLAAVPGSSAPSTAHISVIEDDKPTASSTAATSPKLNQLQARVKQVARVVDSEIAASEHDFHTFTRRALHSYIQVFIGSTLGEHASKSVKEALPSIRTIQTLVAASTVSTTLFFAFSNDARVALRKFLLLSAQTAGFFGATVALYRLLNVIGQKRSKIRQKRSWQHREALLSSAAFTLWILYLNKGRILNQRPAL